MQLTLDRGKANLDFDIYIFDLEIHADIRVKNQQKSFECT
jgi:hypothetical protein